MVRFSAVLLAALLWSGPLWAAEAPAWHIVSDQSSLTFTAEQQQATFDGRFKKFSGDILFDEQNLTGSRLEIIVDLASVDTGSADRDQALPGADWFDAAHFPQAVFKSTEILKQDHGFLAKGTLTLRETTLPVELPFQVTYQKDSKVAVAGGEITLNRLDYGVGQGDWSDVQAVGNAVKIHFSVTAERAD